MGSNDGVPLRLSVKRQLGYKQANYVQRIQLVDSLKPIYGGKGGFWKMARAMNGTPVPDAGST